MFAAEVFSLKAKIFCESLLVRDPEKRLGTNGWSDVEEHAFFEGFSFDALRNGTMKPSFVPKGIVAHLFHSLTAAWSLEVELTPTIP